MCVEDEKLTQINKVGISILLVDFFKGLNKFR